MHDVHRHGVHYLVGDHRPAVALRQALDMPHALAQPLALARAQLGARLQDPILAVELARQHLGERAAPRAELEDAIEATELARECASEEAAELGRGDEVALRAELARAARVIADARFVQRELHVARKRDPAARGGELLEDAVLRRHGENLP